MSKFKFLSLIFMFSFLVCPIVIYAINLERPVKHQSLATPYEQTAALKSDGTVQITKNTYFNDSVLPNVSSWNNIIQIDASDMHIIGLKKDGTVVASGGKNEKGECNVQDWKDIVQVCAGYQFSLGLKSDGTVVVAGTLTFDRNNEILEWENIQKLIVNDSLVIGIDKYGKILSTNYSDGRKEVFQKAFENWTDIKDILVLGDVVFGLKNDGSLVSAGEETDPYYIERTKIGHWKNIVQLAAGRNHVLGLKSDGTVLAAGEKNFRNLGQLNVSGWKNIVEIAAGSYYSVGLKSDGTLVFAGDNEQGQGNIKGWKNIKVANSKISTSSSNDLSNNFKVIVNDKDISSQAKPFFDSSNRIQVPIRAISESLGADVDWNASTKTAVISVNDTEIKFIIGSKNYQVNNSTMTMDTAPVIKDGTIYVPARFVCEPLGCEVNYEGSSKTITINQE